MEKSKKRIHICLLCLMITAVILGILYYYNEVQKEEMSDQGILITSVSGSWYEPWR